MWGYFQWLVEITSTAIGGSPGITTIRITIEVSRRSSFSTCKQYNNLNDCVNTLVKWHSFMNDLGCNSVKCCIRYY